MAPAGTRRLRRNARLGTFLTVLPALLLMSACGRATTSPTATAAQIAGPATEPPIGAPFVTATPPAARPRAVQAAPPPSATPTPTATPVLYVIQPGDTLFDLAIREGMTLEQLLALNPGLQPELLSIGQSIVLPPRPTAEAAEAAIAPDAAGQLTIEGLNWLADSSGRSWVLGELVNQGPGGVQNARVRVTFHAGGGAELAGYDVWAVPDTILPGGRAVFAVLANEGVSDAWQPQAAVTGSDPAAGDAYFDLAADGVEVTISAGFVSYAGRVHNRGDVPASQIVVVAVFYDPQARVVGYRQQLLPETLASGAQATFDGQASLPAGEIADYTFVVQGRVAQ